MASTAISDFPDSAIPPPNTYHFVMQDPSGIPGAANYKISYADLAASIGSAGAVWGAITGTLSDQLDLQAALDAKVNATRAINTTAPLAGGGDLSADRTITTSMNTNKLIGRGTAGVGVMEEITLGTNLSLTGTTLNATGGGSVSATTVEVDLGATPVTRGKFTITDAGISATSKVLVWQAPGPYTGKGTLADEAELAPIRILSVSPATGTAEVRWESKSHVSIVSQMFDNRGGGNRQNAIILIQAAVDVPERRLQATVIGKIKGNVKFSYMILA